jgi:hypothetical protein
MPKEDEPLRADPMMGSEPSEGMRRFINLKPEQLASCLPDLSDNLTVFTLPNEHLSSEVSIFSSSLKTYKNSQVSSIGNFEECLTDRTNVIRAESPLKEEKKQTINLKYKSNCKSSKTDLS